MKLKVYLSGPQNENNTHETEMIFNIAEKAIRNMNLEPVNPLKLDTIGVSWEEDRKACIRALLDCHLILMLPGWEESDNANLEHKVANSLNINQLKIQL